MTSLQNIGDIWQLYNMLCTQPSSLSSSLTILVGGYSDIVAERPRTNSYGCHTDCVAVEWVQGTQSAMIAQEDFSVTPVCFFLENVYLEVA